MGKYELYKDRASYWRWRYISSNGRIISDSGEGYANKTDAQNGIEIMKNSKTSPTEEA